VANGLAELGVDTRICYPVPVYRQPYIARLAERQPAACPQSEWISERVLNLPMFHTISQAQLQHVVDSLKQVLARMPKPARSASSGR
jgi:dTDP-4-amino-4,6-dideoxygalactose transaminase